MSRNLQNVQVKIVPRRSGEGHAFTELLHTWNEGALQRHALSRVSWAIDDTAYGRAAAIAAFIKRQTT